MEECKYLNVEYSIPCNCDIFDHHSYKSVCTLTEEEVPWCEYFCKKGKCKNYEDSNQCLK